MMRAPAMRASLQRAIGADQELMASALSRSNKDANRAVEEPGTRGAAAPAHVRQLFRRQLPL